MSINRLIALGGRGVKSPVERYIDTKGQMERGRLRNVQEQAGYQGMDQNRLAMQATQQGMDIRGQQQKVKGLAAVGKYLDQFPEEQRAAEFSKVDMNQFGLPSVPADATYDKVKPAIEQSKLMVYGEGETPTKRTMPAGTNEKGQNLAVDRLYQGSRVIEQSAPYVKKEITREATVDAGDYGGKVKPISNAERKSMAQEFEIARLMRDLNTEYKDEYSGFMSTNVAELALAAGRRGFAYEDMEAYMTKYQDWKNQVRHSFFGSQLTRKEMTEFEKTTINPAFTAKRNKGILKRHQELYDRGVKRGIGILKNTKGWTDEMIDEMTQLSDEDDGSSTEMSDDEYQQRLNQILNP